MTVFNSNKVDTKTQPMFFGAPLGVQRYDSYKYGWKTSYYQNTHDMKSDEIEEAPSTASLIAEIQNLEEESCESCTI